MVEEAMTCWVCYPKVVSKADEAFHVLVSGGFREVEAFELLLVREKVCFLVDYVSPRILLQELEGHFFRRQQHTASLNRFRSFAGHRIIIPTASKYQISLELSSQLFHSARLSSLISSIDSNGGLTPACFFLEALHSRTLA
jgi:hypothetical protein